MIAGFNTYFRVGGIEFNRLPEVEIISRRHAPLTRIRIRVPDPSGNVYRAVKDRDAVSVILGYRDQEPALWEGTVAGKSVDQNKDQLIVNAVGPERPLEETRIVQAWENETPEAIVSWAIGQAGLEAGQIDSPGVTFPRFAASDIPVWMVARQCEHTCARAFGLDMAGWALWMGKDGRVNWGDFDEASDYMPVIETCANLIRHSPGEIRSGLSRIETFILPHMMHSMKFRITDYRRGVETDYRAVRVKHGLKNSRVRTWISYGEEYERY